MKRILFTIIFISLLNTATVRAELQVIQVRRNIPLSDEEPVYKDYYLSGGNKSGLRTNLVVPVLRWVNLREKSQGQDQSQKILEPVGWLRVVYVQEHLSVARLYEPVNYAESPVLEQMGIMMGDIVSLEHSYVPKSRKVMPKDSAQVVRSGESDVISTSTVAKNVTESPAPKLPTQESAVVPASAVTEAAPATVLPKKATEQELPAKPVPSMDSATLALPRSESAESLTTLTK